MAQESMLLFFVENKCNWIFKYSQGVMTLHIRKRQVQGFSLVARSSRGMVHPHEAGQA